MSGINRSFVKKTSNNNSSEIGVNHDVDNSVVRNNSSFLHFG